MHLSAHFDSCISGPNLGSGRRLTRSCPPAGGRLVVAAAGASAAASASHSSGPSSVPGSSKPGGLGNAVPTQHSFATRQQRLQPDGSGGGGSSGGSSCSTRGLVLYSAALELARNEHYERARHVFEAAVSECPTYVKPWVSWAQMEKRSIARGDERRWANCRTVLQRGLCLNPNAPALLQAWGLLEMQRGNWVAAILLLDRSVRFEPRNSPVLRWKPVVEARQTVGARRIAARATRSS